MTRDIRSFRPFPALALTLLLTGAALAQPESDCNDTGIPDVIPQWAAPEIVASRMMDEAYVAADAPLWDADPMNITLVVETSKNQISVINGDNFELLDRFTTPFGVHGTPAFSPDGRYAFILSRDGWVQKYDIWSLAQVGRVRAGLNSRNIALSADGKWLAVANYLPTSLTILSAKDLSVAIVHEIKGRNGQPSRISAVYVNPPRESFILALKDVTQIWEVFYGPNPPDIGFSHDWRLEGAAPPSSPFPIRKITTPDYLDNFVFDKSYEYVMATTCRGDGGMVIDLVIGHKIAEYPDFGSGNASD